MDTIENADYPTLFRHQIANALSAVLDDLCRGGMEDGRQSDIVLGRTAEILNFALSLPAVWLQTRDLLLALTPQIERQGYWSKWLDYLHTGNRLARERGDLRAYAQLCMWVGVAHRAMGAYAEAKSHLKTSIEQFFGQDDTYGVIAAQNRLAWTERLAGNIQEAETLAHQVLHHLEPGICDPELERARSLSILGAIAYDRGEWQQAENYYRRTQAVPFLSNDKSRLAWGHADLGLALSAQGKYEESLVSYGIALEILEGIHAPAQVATLQMNLAGIYLRLKKPSEALNLCKQAHELFQRIHDHRHLIMVEINIGIAHSQLVHLDEAEEMLVSANRRAKRLKYSAMQVNTLYQLGLLYLDTGHYHKSVETFQRALDCLGNEKPSQQYKNHRQELNARLHQAQVSLAGWG